MPVPAHEPPPHLSPLVQALPSSQGAVVLAWPQAPVPTLHESVVQPLLSLQLATGPGMHALPPQMSPWVQALPSLHGAVLALWVQPVVASQASLVQPLPSSQLTLLPGKQTPVAQASPTLHTELSALHCVPLLALT